MQVQREYDQILNRILEKTARDIRTQVAKLTVKQGIGAKVRVAQLRLVLAQIKREQHRLWINGVRPTIIQGQAAARKAAEDAAETIDRVLYASLPDGPAEAVSRSLKATAEAGLRADAGRVPRELSTRVYRDRDLSTRRVEETIRSGIIRGLSARELASEVYRFVSPTTPGGPSYAALRLARTEINNAFHEQQIKGAARPWVDAVRWNLSGSHKKPDDCNKFASDDGHKLGPGRYPPEDVPGKPHPQCLCFLTYDTVSPDDFLNSYFEGSYDAFLRKTR
jgi:hypothetical protein